MKKRTCIVMMVVSGIACLVLAYMAVRSWKEYRVCKQNLELIEKITSEMKEFEEMRMKELESYLNDSVGPLIEGDGITLTGVRVLMLYGPPPGLMDMPQPR